ncbi:2-succinyl-5-enolpyruvyl-6-hydroxy-3-cyclohexene-1-carboxylic-acid synthase [Flavobacterium magnum]|uniref:2-succinyl-5-enolpyruvyl-6-hydroxy-3-cyclohexene-1-carboxylate synthase n=1 Tax=Flavobacterium magnum TaxID=2162713 RepID=A0A2S0RJV1_9FLAO|nr:2-succinyl-5-enolpyruvyl-6-hydroxy-3-cyclohexene-1-carboxylic-acid synthase [Flavobacterium magnum]AWA31478.1 2-succinyl-5-enolpyruvyl-6-hydroxy-3-cyclohexene-1-carboxylic-acid synthase [Flavobacterium magnum]
MTFPKIPLAQSIIEICAQQGIQHIVISPGSRNAPLTIGFASQPRFRCYSIADERCAAFFALGIAQQLHEPVVLVCTSGSALLNYYPAFAEAFYSQIPLVVISADRPTDKIDIGDGQTIRQQNVYANHSLYNANLSESASAENDAEINTAIGISRVKKGPVHINAPFEEPLYETQEGISVTPAIAEMNVTAAQNPNLANFAGIWNGARKKLLLVGVNEPGVVSDAVVGQIAADPSMMVMTETTSNLHHPSFINNIDTIITPFTEEEFGALQPDLLITFGGMVVSKRIKAFLRKYRPKNHWHIDPLRAYDTFGALTKHFEMPVNDFFGQLAPSVAHSVSDYRELGQGIKDLRARRHEEYLRKMPFCDFKVFAAVMPALRRESQLQISNSAAIRYAQLIEIDPTIEVFCNRGTSGIDGSTSTAIGAALASGKQTTLITGDIGFLYDSNALWNSYIPKNFKIILVNNGGGGIFRILPGHQETPVFNTYFETGHTLTAEHLAKMFGLNYLSANDENTLEVGLSALFASDERPAILEVFTPTSVNDGVLLQYFRELI